MDAYEDDTFVPWESEDARSYVKNLLVDADDDDDVRIHMAVLCGDNKGLKDILAEEDSKQWINFKVRPFQAPPLRLSVTAGNVDCIRQLIKAGASIDLEDIKGQTPLFVATSLKSLPAMKCLLEAGADPEGSRKNCTTPLIIAVRDGFVDGVEILLKFGAKTEPFQQLITVAPCWPLQHAVVYTNFPCFLALLQAGAITNLKERYQNANAAILGRLSIPHAILKYAKDYPEFVHLYRDCGGDLRQPDQNGSIVLSNEGYEKSAVHEALLELHGNPLGLKSLCRLNIRKLLGKDRLQEIYSLGIPSTLHSFLFYEEYNKYSLRNKENSHMKISQLQDTAKGNALNLNDF